MGVFSYATLVMASARSPQRLLNVIVGILDSPDYRHYSGQAADNYESYFRGRGFGDEDQLISPLLLRNFIETVLGFAVGETIGAQERGCNTRPDYVPLDLVTHPFVFDAKASDVLDLSAHYPDKSRYFAAHNVEYLILANMRDLSVFQRGSAVPMGEYSFSFYRLYGLSTQPRGLFDDEDLASLCRFVERFSYRELNTEQKLDRIRAAKINPQEEPDTHLLVRRLHAIVEMLREDSREQSSLLQHVGESDPERARTIAQELELIAGEVDPARKWEEPDERRVAAILADPRDVYAKALDIYRYRVAYFAMTRLLIARMWEDIGFIDQSLLDGGLARWYEAVNGRVAEILDHAFSAAATRYEWLFSVQNNYSWYRPSEAAVVGALYELSNFNLGLLNCDVLGEVYEEYIDTVDRKRKGQYYTPREIIRFIWDRVGYTNEHAFFDCIDGKRLPKRVFDPATGSGGFLAEAARRLRDQSGVNLDCFQDAMDVRVAMLSGLFGSELSVFPYYITEVNLLVQLTPVIKKLVELRTGLKGEHLPLAVLRVDALSLYRSDDSHISRQAGVDEYLPDSRFDTLPLDGRKRAIHKRVKHDYAEEFSYCCSNPPYLKEKGNRDLFRGTLRRYPYWDQFHEARMDYFYWFIILGLSKLREGGMLGFITTAYWPEADGASRLREYVLANSLIREVVYLGDLRPFEHAPGQHNMIFILEKHSGDDARQLRTGNRIKVAEVTASEDAIPGESKHERLQFITDHISQCMGEDQHEDQFVSVYWSIPRQGELTSGRWNLQRDTRKADVIDRAELVGVPLSSLCEITEGVKTGANKVTRGMLRDTPGADLVLGDGIFLLDRDELNRADISDSLSCVRRCFIGEEIQPFAVMPTSERFLLYADGKFNPRSFPSVYNHLAKHRRVLDNRVDVRDGLLDWYRIPRPREPRFFDQGKLVTSYRNERNTFAYCEPGLYGPSGIYFIIPRKGVRESLEYLLAVLNSSVLDTWMEQKGKRKGRIREYTTTTLGPMPIRRIDFGDAREIKLHDEVVMKTRSLIEKKRSGQFASGSAEEDLRTEIDAIVRDLYGVGS